MTAIRNGVDRPSCLRDRRHRHRRRLAGQAPARRRRLRRRAGPRLGSAERARAQRRHPAHERRQRPPRGLRDARARDQRARDRHGVPPRRRSRSSTTAFRNPLPTFEANIRGTYNLLEACRVHRSLVTSVVVRQQRQGLRRRRRRCRTPRTCRCNGRHPYDVSKSCTDLLAMTYADTYELPVAVARCGNIYGGGDLNWSRIVPGTIRSLLARSTADHPQQRAVHPRLHLRPGRGRAPIWRWPSGADDDGVRGEAFNFSPERTLTVLEITTGDPALMRLRQDLNPTILDQARHEIIDQYLDSTKAPARLGWQATHGLEAGSDGDDSMVSRVSGAVADGARWCRTLIGCGSPPRRSIGRVWWSISTRATTPRGFFARMLVPGRIRRRRG